MAIGIDFRAWRRISPGAADCNVSGVRLALSLLGCYARRCVRTRFSRLVRVAMTLAILAATSYSLLTPVSAQAACVGGIPPGTYRGSINSTLKGDYTAERRTDRSHTTVTASSETQLLVVIGCDGSIMGWSTTNGHGEHGIRSEFDGSLFATYAVSIDEMSQGSVDGRVEVDPSGDVVLSEDIIVFDHLASVRVGGEWADGRPIVEPESSIELDPNAYDLRLLVNGEVDGLAGQLDRDFGTVEARREIEASLRASGWEVTSFQVVTQGEWSLF